VRGQKILTTYQKEVEVPRRHTHNSNCDHCRLHRQLAGLSRQSVGVCWLNLELCQQNLTVIPTSLNNAMANRISNVIAGHGIIGFSNPAREAAHE